jgi:hypothetical protein
MSTVASRLESVARRLEQAVRNVIAHVWPHVREHDATTAQLRRVRSWSKDKACWRGARCVCVEEQCSLG